jgi:putative DNA primase/helicase
MDTLPYYQARVPGLYRDGSEYRGRCPGHNGTTDNSIAIDPVTGRWYCHGACGRGGDAVELEMILAGTRFPAAKAAVEAILGLIPTELAAPPKKKPWGQIVAEYDYRDEAGKLLYQVVRFEPKDFRQRTPDATVRDGWNWKIKGLVTPTLYRLDELAASDGVIYIAEGEKDVDALRGLGLTATCNSGGAGKFTASMARLLKGRQVVILRDADEAGHKHGEHVATLLKLEGCRVKLLKLPEVKDPFDWITKGGTRDELAQLVKATAEWEVFAVRAAATDDQGDERGSAPHENAPGLPANLYEMLKTYAIVVGTSEVFDKRRWCFTGKEQVRHAHAADYSAWEKSDDVQKIDVERVVFKPQGERHGELNLFRGLPGKPDGSKSCARIVDHLALLCSGDAGLIHWSTCWLALPLQRRGAKMRTALVIHGKQGTGKNILFEHVMRSIYGEYLDVIGQFEIESRFTGWASRKLFVVCDEVLSDSRGGERVKNRLKMLVTGETVGVEEKNLTRRVEENHMNLVLLSNNDLPVLLEEGDRRYTVARFDAIQPLDYYTALGDEIDKGGAAGFHQYLLDYSLGDFTEYSAPYETLSKAEITEESVSSTERFFEAWMANEIPIPYTCTTSENLYEAYKVWCAITGERAGTVTLLRFQRAAGKRWPTKRMRLNDDRSQVRAIAPAGEVSKEEAIMFKKAADDWLATAQKRRLA